MPGKTCSRKEDNTFCLQTFELFFGKSQAVVSIVLSRIVRGCIVYNFSIKGGNIRGPIISAEIVREQQQTINIKLCRNFNIIFPYCLRTFSINNAGRGEAYILGTTNSKTGVTFHHQNSPSVNYGLIEIKLGGDHLIEEGARTLCTLENKIDPTKMPAPAFKMVLVGVGRYVYRRPDGVVVVPISCLKD